MQGRRSKSKRDAEPIASHGPFYTHGTDSTSEQLGVGGVAFAGVGWEQEQVVGSSNDDLLRCTDRRRWTRDDDLETTLPRDEFTCRSSALLENESSMVVGKAFLPPFSVDTSFSWRTRVRALLLFVLATAGEERRGH